MSGRDYYGVGLGDCVRKMQLGASRAEAGQFVTLLVVYALGLVTGLVLVN